MVDRVRFHIMARLNRENKRIDRLVGEVYPGECVASPVGLLRGLRKLEIPVPELPSDEPKRRGPLPTEIRCPTCAGFGSIARGIIVKGRGQKLKQSSGRSKRKNGDVIRALCPGGYKGTVVEVEMWSTALDDNGGVTFWMDLCTSGLDIRELSYSRFPTHQQLIRKKFYETRLRELKEQGVKNAATVARSVWGEYPRCNSDGSWTKQGVGCEILHKPTGTVVSVSASSFWASRYKAERLLAVKLGVREAVQKETTRCTPDTSSTWRRAVTLISTPWLSPLSDGNRYEQWPYDWWPIRPASASAKPAELQEVSSIPHAS